ncbi:VTT domain-containing protein [Fulvimarina sp. 2208YS6-2-32]|uniref:TVP38/TMEM64 family membrane protein n=1 Tax=Fulvimarina uroteuthidis TaxID=3098149 RepID=A0ABU5I1I8_9HYPH|nr:VTT domain-containing protein [Fulvimarina sp. 2208YS6-2-32]MDY8109245.1 VTT domain-containing protein [Fulvimarina sp. 2208YS6-2-32]
MSIHEPTGDGKERASWLRRLWPVALILAVFTLAYALDLQRYVSLQAFLDSREALRSFVAGNFAAAVLLYVLAYALLVAIAFPAASIITIASGFVFGWLVGGILTVIAATIGAAAIFLAARHAFGDVLRRKAGGAIKRFAEGFQNDAFAYLFVLRLTPVLPFFAVNIAPAFVRIRLRTYVLATFFGIMPGSFVYTFLGSGIDQAVANVSHAGPVTVGDLVTTEMTIALFGLCALAILGLVLKKTFLKGRGALDNEAR